MYPGHSRVKLVDKNKGGRDVRELVDCESHDSRDSAGVYKVPGQKLALQATRRDRTVSSCTFCCRTFGTTPLVLDLAIHR